MKSPIPVVTVALAAVIAFALQAGVFTSEVVRAEAGVEAGPLAFVPSACATANPA